MRITFSRFYNIPLAFHYCAFRCKFIVWYYIDMSPKSVCFTLSSDLSKGIRTECVARKLEIAGGILSALFSGKYTTSFTFHVQAVYCILIWIFIPYVITHWIIYFILACDLFTYLSLLSCKSSRTYIGIERAPQKISLRTSSAIHWLSDMSGSL